MVRKTIEQRIALQGGKEIIDQLRGLGEAGERAFRQIADAAQRAGSPGAQLGKAIGNLKKEFADLGRASQRVRTQFNAVRGSLNNVGSSFQSVALRTAAIGAAVVGAGAALVAFTTSATAAADAAGKTAAALGLTVEEFGRLSFAASQADVGESEFASAITRLNVLLADAAEGSATAIEKFARLGVSLKDASGNLRPTEAILGDIAEAFSRLPDGAQKSALAVELFGRNAGPGLVNLLNGGRQGLRALGDEAERLGLVFTKEQTVIAAALNDSLDALRRTASALRNRLGLLFAPAVTRGSNALIEIINDNRVAIEEFVANVVDRATPLFEDFVALLTGRDADVRNVFLIQARDAMVAFGEATSAAIFGIVIPAYEALLTAAEGAAAAVNAIFGTSLSGQEILIAAAVLQLTGALRALFALAGLAVNSLRLLVAAFGLIGPAISVAIAFFGVLKAGVIAAGAALAGLLSIPGAVVAAVAVAIAAVILYWDEIVAAARVAIDAIIRVAGRLASGFVEAWAAIIQAASAGWQRVRDIVGDGLAAIWQRMRTAGVAVWDAFRSAAQGAISFVSGQLDRLRAAIDRIRAAIARLRANARAENARREQGSPAGDGASGFARGGRVRGPGTGTSDSIPAWLSDGEWVIRAKAVRHYGPALLAAINSMRLPKAALKDRKVPAFATGGPVDVSVRSPAMDRARQAVASILRGRTVRLPARIPAFAAGGPVDARRYAFASPRLAGASRLAVSIPRFPAFAAGGPVIVESLLRGFEQAMAVPMPSFAAGGAVAAGGAGRPVMITIDGQEFGPMQADDDVIDRISRYATQRQVTALGRKPGWYGK